MLEARKKGYAGLEIGDADVVAAHLATQTQGQALHEVLGGAVHGEVTELLHSRRGERNYAQTSVRGEVDDVAGVVLLHHGQAAADSVEHSLAVDIHGAVPFVHVRILQEIDGHVSGIVDLKSHSDAQNPPRYRSYQSAPKPSLGSASSVCSHPLHSLTSSFLLTSTGQAMTLAPNFSNSALQRLISASFRLQIPNLHPSFASASAIPRPIPREAPVMQATFPANETELIR